MPESQQEKSRCPTCKGKRRVLRPGMDPGNPNEKWGDPNRFYMPCPACKGGEADWQEVIIQRFDDGHYVLLDGTQSTDFTNCRRYIPTPEVQAGEDDREQRLRRIAERIDLTIEEAEWPVDLLDNEAMYDGDFLRALADQQPSEEEP